MRYILYQFFLCETKPNGNRNILTVKILKFSQDQRSGLLYVCTLASNFLSLSVSSHLSSLLLRPQSRCLHLFPANLKVLLLCPMAKQPSTPAPSLKPNPTANNPKLPQAAALLHRHIVRHSPCLPSRTPHLRPQ